MYQLCGDNPDKNVKQRHIRIGDSGTKSLHYFHSFAVRDRIDFSDMAERPILTMQADQKHIVLFLLPSSKDDIDMRKNNICVLMSIVLFNNVDFFKTSLDGVINWHIEHQYYEEMSQKSEVERC